MNLVKSIPNILTLTNLFLGCIGITYLFTNDIMYVVAQEGETTFGSFSKKGIYYIQGKMLVATYIILIAGVLDFLDGAFAKMFKAQSELGKQLDSLADLVTFGVLPGMMMFQIFSFSFYSANEAFTYPVWIAFLAFLIPVFAALRLGRYNLQASESSSYFKGLAVPAMALFVAGLSQLFHFHPSGFLFRSAEMKMAFVMKPLVVAIVVFALCALMVSKIKMINLKPSSKDDPNNKGRLITIVGSLIIGAIGLFVLKLGFGIFVPIILWYIIVSILMKPIDHEVQS